MKTVRLALDWTPNVNHLGFFVARELGMYERRGIAIEIIDPRSDNYTVTPGKRLELGEADLAIAPFETVISLNNKTRRVDAVAVYAILQTDLSSIATLATSPVASPRDLDGRTYASYKARYEDHIVRAMVVIDGGVGDLRISYPEKLGIWNTLLRGDADATWIFDNWEGVEASTNNIALTRFAMSDYGIPYGYSPVVLTRQHTIEQNRDALVQFLDATREGFLHVQQHVDDAQRILAASITREERDRINLVQSIMMTAPHFGSATTCGVMEPQRVDDFLRWLVDAGLESSAILDQQLFTNELLSCP